MSHLFHSLIVVCCFWMAVLPPATGQESAEAVSPLKVAKDDEHAGWKVLSGDQVVLGYRSDFAGTPILFPLIGPGGQHLTRGFPIQKAAETERADHDHHRSVWLTHGDVNGTDFWIDDEGNGRIRQTAGKAWTENGCVVIETENDWRDPQGKRLLSDTRRVTVQNVSGRRVLDFDFLLKATDGDVNFGDTKEGSFGIRVAGTMKVDAKLGGVITNAESKNNKDAWGKKSAWVDYSGPVDEQVVGVTIHDHPSSFGYPCRWHVRTYGLFAANPFGVHHFIGGKKTDGVVLPQGESMRLSYRMVLHDGPLDVAQTKADSGAFAETQRPELK